MEFITLTRLQHSGVPADLDPTRFGSPGPNPLADMDPPLFKSAKGYGHSLRGFGPPQQN